MKPKYVHVVLEDSSWERWEVGNKLHREDGPAYIGYENGEVVKETWALNGMFHNENGPAIIDYENGEVIEEYWYVNNFLHRKDGPAWIKYRNGKIVIQEWWVNNRRFSKKDFGSLEMINEMQAWELFEPHELVNET